MEVIFPFATPKNFILVICTVLDEFPKVMTVKPVRTDEYLLAKLEHKKIIGSDAGYNVFCVQCGCLGARGVTKEEAAIKWNSRVDSTIAEKR